MYSLKNLITITLLCLVISGCIIKQNNNVLPRSTPEAEGVSSAELIKFVDATDKSIKEMHSFMFLRHGKVIAEGWWNPYRPEYKHTMYSLSKSFTSTAVGFAVSEKLLSLNDTVISFFPNELPDTISKYLSEMTVRNLITMTAGQAPDPTFKVVSSSDWVKTFLSTPVVDKPGTKYLYNSLATFMLSAIVQKATGEKIIDFLEPRFFKPLGIEGIDWEMNAQGINAGGWGLRLKTEDIAKAGQFYLQEGNWNGEQILPVEWIKEATSFKIEQAPQLPQTEKDSSDWMQGYGYQFSLCRHNGYRGDGAYGQFMIVLPDKDAVIVMTAEKGNMQPQLNLVWKYLLPAIKTGKLPSDPKALSTLRNKLSSLSLPLNKVSSSPLEKIISEKTYLIDQNDQKIKTVSLRFSGNMCHMTFKIDSTNQSLDFEKGKWTMGETLLPAPNLIPNKMLAGDILYKVAMSSAWKADNILELTLRYIETAHNQRMIFSFDQNNVTISFRNIFSRTRNIPDLKGEFVK